MNILMVDLAEADAFGRLTGQLRECVNAVVGKFKILLLRIEMMEVLTCPSAHHAHGACPQIVDQTSVPLSDPLKPSTPITRVTFATSTTAEVAAFSIPKLARR